MLYNAVFKNLNAGKVRYLVVGGMAVVLHGIPRATIDLDILADMTPKNLTALLHILGGMGYKPRPPVNPMDFANEEIRKQWVREKNMAAFPLIHKSSPLQQIDILADSPLPYAEAVKNRIVLKVNRISVPLISIRDLITLKNASGRSQDIADIAALKIAEELE